MCVVENTNFGKASISIAGTKIDIAHTDYNLLNEITLGYFTPPDRDIAADYTIFLIPLPNLSILRQTETITKLIGFSDIANAFYDSIQGNFIVELTYDNVFFILYDVADSLILEPKFFHMPFGRIANRLGLVPIHASCMMVEGKGILAVGKSGSGKSSIVAAAATLGINIIGDDILWAGIVNQEATIYATSKSVKLLNPHPSFEKMTQVDPYINERGKKLFYLSHQFEHLFMPKVVATHGVTLSLSAKSRLSPTNRSGFLRSLLPSTITMFSDPKMTISICKSLADLLSLHSFSLEERNDVNLTTLISYLRA